MSTITSTTKLEDMIGPDLALLATLRHGNPETTDSLVGFVGCSRSGKDTAALVLDALGYSRASHGDLLKAWFQDAFQCGHDRIECLVAWTLFHKGPGPASRCWVALEYYWDHNVDPFTNGPDKDEIRPALEYFGAKHEYELLRETVNRAKLPAYNQRVYNASQVKAWGDAGGVSIYVDRMGVGPATPFEEKAIHGVFKGKGLNYIIPNDGSVERLWLRVLVCTGHLTSSEAFPGTKVTGWYEYAGQSFEDVYRSRKERKCHDS